MFTYLFLFVMLLLSLFWFFLKSETKEQFLEVIHIPKNAGTTIGNIAKNNVS